MIFLLLQIVGLTFYSISATSEKGLIALIGDGLYVCGWDAHMQWLVWRAEDNELVLSFPLWVPGIKPRSSGLVVNALTS